MPTPLSQQQANLVIAGLLRHAAGILGDYHAVNLEEITQLPRLPPAERDDLIRAIEKRFPHDARGVTNWAMMIYFAESLEKT